MYRIAWSQHALDELAAIWVAATSSLRAQITEAASSIDEKLSADPFAVSESRDNNERVCFGCPLALTFEVDEERQVVWILHLWQYKRRGA